MIKKVTYVNFWSKTYLSPKKMSNAPLELFFCSCLKKYCFLHITLHKFSQKFRLARNIGDFFSSGGYISRVKNLRRQFFAQTSRGTSASGALFNLTMGEPVSLAITKLKDVAPVPNTFHFTLLQVRILKVMFVNKNDRFYTRSV